VAFFLVGEIERARRAAGDRSYRDLLIESGTIGQRIYLAAEAAGLAARNLAAFRDDAVNRLLDGSERPALHLTLVGYDTPRAS
jgi:nitroreductase